MSTRFALARVVDGGDAGAGEHGTGVVTPEERRRQVEHVAIDESAGVEVVRHGRSAFHQQLHDALVTELVEDLFEVAAHRRGGFDASAWWDGAEHDPAQLDV